MTVQEVRERLADLVRVVSLGHKRVQIATPSGDVMLISKTEIEALERALNIMSETTEFKAIAHSLHRIAAATVEQPVVA
jgi:PHD/YefM family antitoxin component YafN of YafNO toxin-antitoxin module